MKDYYNILQVNRDAGEDEIRQSFRRLSMQYHPDRHGGGGKYYEEKFKEINEAYQVLKDPIRRWQYKQDSQRRREPAPGTPGAPGPSAWQTPDYAARHQRPHREKAQARRGAGAQQARQAAGQGGAGGLFWSVVLVLILFLPFAMAGREPAASAGGSPRAQTVSYSQSAEFADYQAQLNHRFQRELALFRSILRSDPNLDGLDRDTGFYTRQGESFQFSWEMMELVREQGL